MQQLRQYMSQDKVFSHPYVGFSTVYIEWELRQDIVPPASQQHQYQLQFQHHFHGNLEDKLKIMSGVL